MLAMTAGAQEEVTKHKFDKETFVKIGKKALGAAISGNVSIDAALTNMEQLTSMGVAGCEEHMSEPETPDAEKKILQATIETAKKDENGKHKMAALTLEQIEKE